MRRELFLAAPFCVALVVAACSANTTTPPAAARTASLPAAEATACVGANGANQIFSLPTTGGVAGTLSLGPVPAAASGCPLTIDVATGADATLGTTTQSLTRREAQASTSLPIAQVQLSTQSTTSIGFFGVTFTFPASVPPGTYPVVVTQRVLGGNDFNTVQILTLTVNANGTATLNSANVPIGDQNVSVVISVYPSGTVLTTPTPAVTPSPTPTATAGTSPTPSPTAAPTAAPTPIPTATPTPVPTGTPMADCAADASHATSCGSYEATGTYDGGPNSGQPATSSGTLNDGPVPGSLVNVPGFYFTGTIVVTLPGYNPGYQQTLVAADSNCATVGIEQSGPNGDTYTFSFQADGNQYEFLPSQGCNFYVEPPTYTNPSAPGFDASEHFTLNYGYGNGSTWSARARRPGL